MGYFGRGSIAHSPSVSAGGVGAAQPMPVTNPEQPDRLTLDQLKLMADKKAEPLLKQLQAQPQNAATLREVADIYFTSHQFKDAIPYYERTLEVDPKNVGVRADLASCLFYAAEVDKSIATLEEALRYDPNNAQALFNLGMIRWKEKGDSARAVALWQHLLKTNPNLPTSRKQDVEKVIAEASQAGVVGK
jgi:cytochrome c-type biogenesis protein CcmH/NrfG